VRMPRMGGMDFFLGLQSLRPALARRLVFVSGHVGDKTLEQEMTRWDVPLVAKPFTPRRLIEVCAPFFAAPREPAESG
jgi:FixJ family two-component response regulator